MAKEYKLNFMSIPYRTYKLTEQACVFCKHCYDVLYDSKGIHYIFCDKGNHCADFGNSPPVCKEFEEEI